MKTAIIVLTIIIVALFLYARGIKHHIKNNDWEKMMHALTKGTNKKGNTYSTVTFLWEMLLVVDILLMLMYFLS